MPSMLPLYKHYCLLPTKGRNFTQGLGSERATNDSLTEQARTGSFPFNPECTQGGCGQPANAVFCHCLKKNTVLNMSNVRNMSELLSSANIVKVVEAQ